MDDLTTERSFDSQAALVIDMLGLFFDTLSMGVCTTRRLADVRSTGAGIKWLYYINSFVTLCQPIGIISYQ